MKKVKKVREPPQEEQPTEEINEDLFSDVTPQSLNLQDRIISVLEKKMKITRLTKIQAESYHPIIEGKDVLMRADTGSGKTLSYLIPIMQCLVQRFPRDTNPIDRSLGPLVVIICPTRELCLQTSTVVDKFKSQMAYITPGVLLGGEKVASEKKRIRKGINILITTPGRIQYHLKNTQNLTFPHLQFLVLDEADRLLDMGFLKPITEVINSLPPRQTILVSATLHRQLQQLTEISLTNPVTVGEAPSEDFSIPPTLLQRFLVVRPKWRLTSLASLLLRCVTDIPNMKAIVFINNCLSVDFHYTFFSLFNFMTPAERHQRKQGPRKPKNEENEENKKDEEEPKKEATIQDIHASTDNDEIGSFSPYLNCPIFRIHGNVDQIDRAKTISKYTTENKAILFCTDVAARGLDIPDVTTIIQFDPPIDTEDYVHRVGRTARIGKDGIAYLFLQEFELGFINLLQTKKVDIKEYPYKRLIKRAVSIMQGDDEGLCIAAMKKETESTVESDKELENLAARAWASTIKAYTSHRKETRKIFDKTQLHLGQMAASFGLTKTPGDLKRMLAEERELLSKSKTPNEEDADKAKFLPAFEERTSEFL
ncbi:ATP-dependent RNA helicase dbp7 [Histomonas meleagridis]|uniref:ATP-dependent RNA helicase dbp7 n=1 Tax=Histomonas meleagridis TaxID=135588 RepID=UPI00355AC4F0|nr:ATP-dependent RNA helicase dbp7 [Histomonas meleagridis]KAH0804333.1 ATP-dependent RNA helicase dbp7 [Histomonas meleagridis]